MECVKCGEKARCIETRTYHLPGQKHAYQRRMYVCPNERCNAVFYYKATFMGMNEAIDARKYIEMREAAKARQYDLFNEKTESQNDDNDD